MTLTDKRPSSFLWFRKDYGPVLIIGARPPGVLCGGFASGCYSVGLVALLLERGPRVSLWLKIRRNGRY